MNSEIRRRTEWAVQRSRFVTPKTIAPLNNNALVKLTSRSNPPENVFAHRRLNTFKGHNPRRRGFVARI
jgi:hypothetical protein